MGSESNEFADSFNFRETFGPASGENDLKAVPDKYVLPFENTKEICLNRRFVVKWIYMQYYLVIAEFMWSFIWNKDGYVFEA